VGRGGLAEHRRPAWSSLVLSMTTRTIVTSHPGVACDLCGRRLLRGEQPGVFVGGGQQRTVCELCVPRAAHEGWQRASERAELERDGAGWRGRRPQRGRSLLGRLGWPGSDRGARPVRAARPELAGEVGLGESDPAARPPAGGARALEDEWDGIGDEWAGASGVAGTPREASRRELADGRASAAAQSETQPELTEIGLEAAAIDSGADNLEAMDLAAADTQAAAPPDDPAELGHAADVQAGIARALEIFNAGEHPRRIAGVARALGPACVKVAPLAGATRTVAIVVAWELCWYRYEVDLGDEAAGARLAAEGMELEELPAEDRVANAGADERGELALLVPGSANA
jgi:hypothetical protein